MYSLISQIAPKKYASVFQAISLLSIGIAAKTASLIGAAALTASPFEVFKVVVIVMAVVTFILFLIKLLSFVVVLYHPLNY